MVAGDVSMKNNPTENAMRKNTASRINTDTSLINSLITGISQGEIKVPQFQRKFVWKDEQAIALLDSIAKNYPVGSLLFWRTREKLRVERNIGEFQLPHTDDMEPTDYVLDGQQRLTVIYSCLGAKEDDKSFSVIYDLEERQFLRFPDNPKIHHFPLRRMFHTTKLLNFRTALQTLPSANEYQERLDTLIHAFQEYRLPVVTLKDLSVEEVCPIFERINSSGTKLSTYDLMVAATWNKDFDLNDEVDEICEALRPKGFEDISRNTVLKCLSAVKLGTIKEESLKTLRTAKQEDMRELIETTKGALLRTVDLLSTEFKIYSWDFLSYEALVVILCYVYAQTKHLSPEQITRTRQWFWRSSFAERYKVGGENFVSRDLSVVFAFIVSAEWSPSDFGNAPSEKEWKSLSFRSNASRSLAYILALAARRPRNITNGAYIDSAIALSAYNKKQFHHVYPRAYLKRIGAETDDNLIINICMLSAVANNTISDSNPVEYLPKYAEILGESADSVFESNILPKPSELDYSKSTYDDFLDARSPLVASFIAQLCDGHIPQF
jgi:hypothetical protein